MEIRFRPRKSLWFLTCQSCLGDFETNEVNIHGELILVVVGKIHQNPVAVRLDPQILMDSLGREVSVQLNPKRSAV
jgi:hypothetical protein